MKKRMMVAMTVMAFVVLVTATTVMAGGPSPSTAEIPVVVPATGILADSLEQIHLWKLTFAGGYLSKVLRPQGLIAEKYELIVGANRKWDENSWQDENTGETIYNRFTDDCYGFDLDSGSGPRKKISCSIQYNSDSPVIYLYLHFRVGNQYVVFNTTSFYNQSGQGDLTGFYTGETMRYNPSSYRWVIERIFGGVFEAQPE